MLGFSYGELFLLLGATAALIGPKDLPIIAKTAERLAGRAIGYVQLTRGQFETVLQQSQARQDSALPPSHLSNLHSQAVHYAKLAESPLIKNGLSASSSEVEKNDDQLMVLPASARDWTATKSWGD